MAKHLLYLTNNQLTAFIWDKGVLSAASSFDNYESGWLKFSAYLGQHRQIPLYLLTDLIEEDFQRENIPHVYGSAKKNLIQRRLLNLYRDTPFRTANFQGRERAGRKDDQMLFSALTNTKLLKPWTDALLSEKIDVVGIYSVALLSSLLFKKLDLGKEPALLITHQSSGLRQSFFQDGHLRFSRLAPETAWSPESIAEVVASEMTKIRQFLASTRQLARGELINIIVVANAKIIANLRPLCVDADGARYRFIDLTEASNVFDITKLYDLVDCDALFFQLLAGAKIPSHYTTEEHAQVHHLTQIRAACNWLSLLTISTAAVVSAGYGIEALHANEMTLQARQDTQRALTQYQATVTSMPVTVANSHDMKSAVDLHQLIHDNGPTPVAMLAIISHALDQLPPIKVRELTWQIVDVVSSDAAAAAEAPPLDPGVAVAPMASLIGIPNKPVQIIQFEGDVEPFKNDYRSALDNVNQFISALKKNNHIEVEMTTPPIDIRPTVKLESQAGNDEALPKPHFSLKITWKP